MLEISEFLRGPVVDVIVGPDKIKFIVHEQIFTARSPFARAGLSAEWKAKDAAKTLTLEDTTPEAFTFYTHFMYTGRLTDDTSDEDQLEKWRPVRGQNNNQEIGNQSHMKAAAIHFDLLAICYCLGDYLQDFTFCNAVINAMTFTLLLSHIVPYNNWRNAYDNTSIESPLRRLLTDLHVYHQFLSGVRKSDLVHDLVLDIVDEAMNMVKSGRVGQKLETLIDKEPCRYHVHTEDQDARACATSMKRKLRELRLIN